MILDSRFTAPDVHLTRAEQLGVARMDARAAVHALGHTLGEWRSGGRVADDEAACLHCGAAVFLAYGDTALRPLLGLSRVGTALSQRCERSR